MSENKSIRDMAEPKRHNHRTMDEDRNRLAGGAVANPEGIASILRDARMKMGVELRDVADALRIQYAYLRAIEDARYADLPGPTYALGFVRTYAEYLNLDSREIARRFKEEARGLSRRQALVFPEPLQEGRFPGGTLLIAALVIAAGVYIGWNYWQQKHTAHLDAVSPPPANLASRNAPESAAPLPSAPSPAPTPSEAQASSPSPAGGGAPTNAPGTVNPGSAGPSAATPPAPSPAADQTATTASAPSASASSTSASSTSPSSTSALSAASPEVGAVVPTPEPKPADIPARTSVSASAQQPAASAVAGTPPAPPPDDTTSPSPSAPEQVASVKPNEPHVFGENNAASRITLAARQDSWVQVRDKDSNVVWTRMLRSGDSYKVPNQPGLTLLTGNAGALSVWVDGRSAPPLGPEGAVRRNIALDPDKVAAGTAGSQ
ncbi:MAG TPA: RodZ domain-containing protein [Alphaproteobacteria bacterium]